LLLLAGILMFTRCDGCSCKAEQVAFPVVGPFVSAGIGVAALIDGVTVSPHTVYRTGAGRGADLRIAPVVGPGTREFDCRLASE
jgi:hypothetical protein